MNWEFIQDFCLEGGGGGMLTILAVCVVVVVVVFWGGGGGVESLGDGEASPVPPPRMKP